MAGGLLRDYAEDFEVEGVAVRGLAREAEVAVAAAHAVYKEHMVLLIDCLTLERWLSRRAVEASRELGVERALWVALSACRSIRAGSAEAPYRLPFPLLAGVYAEKTLGDAWFRGTLPNALRYLAGREGAGRVLLSRLTRRSY
ncbi:hypothetical protein [Infirmifilum sp. NZ]|uniref:hypothetical protein n=1 Tax=Infirmifilum sp. NZ TaxID=2926850 RepID=UPI0027A0395D|nr:hypothetical protein [Infirmifilum sp. NZ]UNQ73160.1 hypothetical protein MOV14_08615 [Infirmifilum sp. NZ]